MSTAEKDHAAAQVAIARYKSQVKAAKVNKRKAVSAKMLRAQNWFQDTVFSGVPVYERTPLRGVRAADYRKGVRSNKPKTKRRR
jgi:hypothetical protein